MMSVISEAAARIVNNVIVKDEQVVEYIRNLIRLANGALMLDEELMPALRRNQSFLMLKHYAGGPANRASVLNFLTKPGRGFVLLFDGQTAWIHSKLPKVPTKRQLAQPSNPTVGKKKKPRRSK